MVAKEPKFMMTVSSLQSCAWPPVPTDSSSNNSETHRLQEDEGEEEEEEAAGRNVVERGDGVELEAARLQWHSQGMARRTIR